MIFPRAQRKPISSIQGRTLLMKPKMYFPVRNNAQMAAVDSL